MTTDTATRTPYRTITVAAAAKQGLAPRRMTAEALHAWLPADGSLVAMWEREGHDLAGCLVYGVHHFRRSQTPGHPGVEIVAEDGNVVIRFPLNQGRTVRVLGKTA